MCVSGNLGRCSPANEKNKEPRTRVDGAHVSSAAADGREAWRCFFPLISCCFALSAVYQLLNSEMAHLCAALTLQKSRPSITARTFRFMLTFRPTGGGWACRPTDWARTRRTTNRRINYRPRSRSGNRYLSCHVEYHAHASAPLAG